MTNRTDISQSLPDQSLPVANYSPAVARAVAWLGDRYLLAKPINAARRSQSAAMNPLSSLLQGDSTKRRA
jgi:hypothetical protein